MVDCETGDLQQWVGKTETVADEAALAPLKALAATLDRDSSSLRPGDDVPPCWQWLYFPPLCPQSEIGADGHPRRGGFLPPVSLPRRMWAGSRLEFRQPLRIGERIIKRSCITDVTRKQGSAGSLVFVRVHHEIAASQGVAVVEEQDIVYRDVARQAGGAATRLAPTDEQFSRQVRPDPVLLFRYSALTFNAHRIHYDRAYAVGEEGYAGLVVHGPLLAILLLDELQRVKPEAHLRTFEFKAVSPLLDTAAFEICGRLDRDRAVLWARGPQGELAMQATAVITADSG